MKGSQVQYDFRVHVGFFTHRKTLRLEREAGPAAVLAILRLWAYAAQNHPTGDLGTMDDLDIAAVCGWTDPATQLIDALVSCGFLDAPQECAPDPVRIQSGSGADTKRIRCGYVLHDWSAHQPYVARRDERKACAKRANEARWRRRKSLSRKGSSEADPLRIRTGSAPDTKRSPPSPPPKEEEMQSADAAAAPSGAPPCAALEPWTPPAPMPGLAIGPRPRFGRRNGSA